MSAPPWDTTPTRPKPRRPASAATFFRPAETRSTTCWADSPTGRAAKLAPPGAPIQAYDLRDGAALVIAALAAEGESEISNVQYIERGYEDIIGKLRALGADIRAVEEPDEDALSTAQIS